MNSVDELSMRVGKAASGPRIRPSHMAGFFPSCLWGVDISLAIGIGIIFYLLSLGPRRLGAKRDLCSLQVRKEESSMNVSPKPISQCSFLADMVSYRRQRVCRFL